VLRERTALDRRGRIELSINPCDVDFPGSCRRGSTPDRARKLREASLPKESNVCFIKGISQYLKRDALRK